MGLIFFLLMVLACYLFGKWIQKKNFDNLIKKERQLRHIAIFNEKYYIKDVKQAQTIRMVSGSTVMSCDYFKQLLAGIKSIFGGRLNSYEAMMELGRRVSIIRMKEEASKLGANAVFNVRIETSMLGEAKNISTEFFAYGTAIKIEK